jgi:hypothetical protein
MSTEMQEFYFLGGGSCVPNANFYGGLTAQFMYTDTSSDVTYISASACGTPIPDPSGQMQSQPRYAGTKSLQCGIDGYVWDYRYATNRIGVWRPYDDGTSPITQVSLLFQTKFAHDYGEKHWALLQGGQDMPPDCTYNCCPIRIPTPNEVKLGAWLAVACDVDGIMWYPWNFGGMIDWDTAASTFRPNVRYDSAKVACNRILEVAPILESLDFVKTYASRAFERNYPDATYPATTLDTLATNTNWYDQSFRMVDLIRSYPEDTTQVDGWATSADANSYVQVSRYRHDNVPLNDTTIENYWFLLVNRRALGNERRKIELLVQTDTTYHDYPYYVHYVLGDSTIVAQHLLDGERTDTRLGYRVIVAILEPGEGQLVHFYRGGLGCEDNRVDILDLTAIREDDHSVRLRWTAPDTTEDGLPFTPSAYRIFALEQFDGTYSVLDSTADTTWVDTYIETGPPHFYMVQACGEIHARIPEDGYTLQPKERNAKAKALTKAVNN